MRLTAAMRRIVLGALNLDRRATVVVTLPPVHLAHLYELRPDSLFPDTKAPVFHVPSEACVHVGCDADTQSSKRVADLRVTFEVG